MNKLRTRLLVDGLLVGLVGYAAVAVFFGILDLVSGRPFFHTAALLGSGLVAGSGAGAGTAATGAVLAYNSVHLVAFMAVGLALAWLVSQTARHPEWWLFTFFAATTGLMGIALVFFLLIVPATAGLPWWSVLGANAAAGLGMTTYLFLRHRDVWASVERQPTTTM